MCRATRAYGQDVEDRFADVGLTGLFEALEALKTGVDSRCPTTFVQKENKVSSTNI